MNSSGTFGSTALQPKVSHAQQNKCPLPTFLFVFLFFLEEVTIQAVGREGFFFLLLFEHIKIFLIYWSGFPWRT